jgi:hypothetical protein
MRPRTKKVFLDRTGTPPHVFYAQGDYLNSEAVSSYYFTPKSKKLYRVDITLKDLPKRKLGRGTGVRLMIAGSEDDDRPFLEMVEKLKAILGLKKVT